MIKINIERYKYLKVYIFFVMKKKEIELKFIQLSTEFKLIKRMVFAIFTIIIGLLLKIIWDSATKNLIP